MLNLSTVMIGTANPKALAEFYEKIFEKPADMEEGGWYGWSVGNSYFTIGEHSEVHGQSKEPARIMINFETTRVEEEYNRIKEIEGTVVVKEPYEMGGGWVVTFADPDGNYFQLASPWKM